MTFGLPTLNSEEPKYNLSMNREKNKKFSEDYNLTAKKIENIILNLDVMQWIMEKKNFHMRFCMFSAAEKS
ncbi:MAG: hypothetical protein CI953_1671 [Methanohalophilus sp.]|nr:MAG: hypothetical protein CI953_1671 [Methanohalophilus sp.]